MELDKRADGSDIQVSSLRGEGEELKMKGRTTCSLLLALALFLVCLSAGRFASSPELRASLCAAVRWRRRRCGGQGEVRYVGEPVGVEGR